MEALLRKLLSGERRCLQDEVLVEDDAARQIGLRALDVFEQLPYGSPPSCECMEAIAEAARSLDGHVGCTGAWLLSLLAADHEKARETICELLSEQTEEARFSAVAAASWERNLPTSFVEEILRRGLGDPSKKIRMYAADKAMELGVGTLLPEMLRISAQITDEEEIECVSQNVELLRDGFTTPAAFDGDVSGPGYLMTIRLEDGQLIGSFVREEELNARGPAALAKENAKRYLEKQLAQGSQNQEP